MFTLPKPSKKIIVMIASAIIIVGAIGANKFWPGGKADSLITPGYSAPNIAEGIAPANSIDGTAFLQQFATSSAATTTDDTPATPSREIARTLFANAAYLSSSNSLDETSKAALVQNTINQIQNSFTYKQYDASGLSYLSNENYLAIKSYASEFATLQISMIVEMQARVAQIEGDISVLGDIYARQAQALYALKIPPVLAGIHLEIVNNFSKSGAAMKAFANQKNDPFAIPIAMKISEQASTDQAILLGQLAQFIFSNGIIFTSDEAGGYWNAFSSTATQ